MHIVPDPVSDSDQVFRERVQMGAMIPREDYHALKVLAAIRGTTVAELVRTMVGLYLERTDSKIILGALARNGWLDPAVTERFVERFAPPTPQDAISGSPGTDARPTSGIASGDD